MSCFTEEKLQPVADDYGIPVDLILEIVIEIMQQCFDNQEEAARNLANITPMQRAFLRMELRRQTKLKRKQVRRLASDLEDLSESLSQEEIATAYDDCNFYRA